MIEYISNPYRSNLFTCSKYGFLALGFFFMYLNQLINNSFERRRKLGMPSISDAIQ